MSIRHPLLLLTEPAQLLSRGQRDMAQFAYKASLRTVETTTGESTGCTLAREGIWPYHWCGASVGELPGTLLTDTAARAAHRF